MQRSIYCSIRTVLDYFEIKIFLSNTYSGDTLVVNLYEAKNSLAHFLEMVEASVRHSQKAKKKAFQDFIEKIKILSASNNQLNNSEARLVRDLHKVLLCTRRAFNKRTSTYMEILHTNIFEFPEDSEIRNCKFFSNKRKIFVTHLRSLTENDL